jgi:DNA-binding NtrC family response regulator
MLSRDNSNRANANVSTGSVGRPSFEISKEQLEFLLDCNFEVQEISEILKVSKRTIERRMNNYELTAVNVAVNVAINVAHHFGLSYCQDSIKQD